MCFCYVHLYVWFVMSICSCHVHDELRSLYMPVQRRQSGLKSGGRGSGSTKFRFSRQISEKFRFFQASFWKVLIFPGKFLKNFDFFRKIFERFRFFQAIFQNILIFQAKIAHLQLFLDKLFYFSSKVTTFERWPDKMVADKMVYGENGTDKMVWTKWYNFICCVHFNSVEFDIYLVTKSHK